MAAGDERGEDLVAKGGLLRAERNPHAIVLAVGWGHTIHERSAIGRTFAVWSFGSR
jgi:hypothetical protein